ncbi:hypothetical protein AX17_003875 [Amanita inopinata Kibby_2008]|nr:hypothetical protein AX17_003875 [Amanita inopinata Kibby_2008]
MSSSTPPSTAAHYPPRPSTSADPPAAVARTAATTTAAIPTIATGSTRTLHRVLAFLSNLLIIIFTFNIPTFYASRGQGGGLGLQGAVTTWKIVRTFAAILLVVMASVLFRVSPFAGTSFWFFNCSSAILAFMGLLHSNVLLVYFARDTQLAHGQSAEALSFSFYSIWSLFSLPAIWTTW